MSVRLHLIARWYEMRARRAYRQLVRFKEKAEAAIRKMGEG